LFGKNIIHGNAKVQEIQGNEGVDRINDINSIFFDLNLLCKYQVLNLPGHTGKLPLVVLVRIPISASA